MSNEIRISARLSFSKGGAKANAAHNITVDVTGDAFTHEVQEVGTTREELAQGADLGTPGYIVIKNLDSTNYVEVGPSDDDTSYCIKLLAGEVAIYRHDSATVYAKANTAAVLCEYLLIEA